MLGAFLFLKLKTQNKCNCKFRIFIYFLHCLTIVEEYAKKKSTCIHCHSLIPEMKNVIHSLLHYKSSHVFCRPAPHSRSAICSANLIISLLTFQELVSQNCVVIFSKTTCPYCKMAKSVFNEIGANYKVIELDEHNDGRRLQEALAHMTGARTVRARKV